MAFEHVQLATPVVLKLDVRSLPTAAGAYCGKNRDYSTLDPKKAYTSTELQEELGFELLRYNRQ